ncbi:MAG TPA: isocitrate/isopropylmalate dehydrogenase family protein [Candidatus Poseidoniales archaeon]|nr:isocitrate/isopropylmalate dehydrogenase family protein [Candidatus Poseidoniales archaeon]
MHTYRVASLPGDGTGREVMQEALNMLTAIESCTNLRFDVTTIPCGGQHYLDTGREWDDGSFEFCRDEADVILLGAIGWPGARLPNGDLAGGQVILGLRSELDLYANIRPIKLYSGVQHKVHGQHNQIWKPELVDMILIRENTEGLYHSLLRRSADKAIGREPYEPEPHTFPGLEGEVAWDPRPISRKGSERVIKMAFEIAQYRNGCPSDGTQRVTCVDKSNVSRGCQLFRRVFDEVGDDYSGVSKDYAYIDAFTMWLIRQPEWFDVAVLPNMFGDIATDLAAVLQGGMGMAPSGNIGVAHALFEPVHGSAPKHAGKGKVNPIATLLSVHMMLSHLSRRKEDAEAGRAATAIEQAVEYVVSEGTTLTYDLGGTSSTNEVGAAIIERTRHYLTS